MLYSAGYMSDYLLKNNKMGYTLVRKVFCCSGLVAQAFFMIIMALTTNVPLLIICINLSIGFGGLPWSSFGVNHLDIGAGYANVLMSISNTFATLPGIISPILTGHLIENKVNKISFSKSLSFKYLYYLFNCLNFEKRLNLNGILYSGLARS